MLSIPMKQLSRSIVFVDTNEKIAVLATIDQLDDDDDDDNVFQKSFYR